MLTSTWIACAWLGLAIGLEVLANLLLKYSDGFRKRGLGVASILSVLLAFTALAQAVRDIELSVAYAVWGGFGILATVAMGWVLFGQRLVWRGWLGLALLVAGMGLLKLA
ncbi:multidrug/spermidine efflux SMR transporter subunit MdtI [Pseudomonas panipatensis]|uniref:multidrug/spermidine efflux SMR transporter subunit MdtI n=1 Tax=Pseudomonas panipatensis TaxID=428992 RepID=UPI0035AF5659